MSPGFLPRPAMKRWIFSQSSLTMSAVAEECGTHVLAYLAIRLSTGSMFVTVWPYTFSKGWLPPPIQIGGGGVLGGLGAMVRVLSWGYFAGYVAVLPAPGARPTTHIPSPARPPPPPRRARTP